MSDYDYIQISKGRFIRRDSIVGVEVLDNETVYFFINNGGNNITFPPRASKHYATIALEELGISGLTQENVMTVRCLEAIDKFVAWWNEQPVEIFYKPEYKDSIERELAKIPPQPKHFHVPDIVLNELGGRDEENPHNDDNRVILYWNWKMGWCVGYATQRPIDPYWRTRDNVIASYVHTD